jgi:hypothetical protein
VSLDPGASRGRARVSYPGTYRIVSGDRALGELEVSRAAIDAGTTIHIGRGHPPEQPSRD